MMPFKAFYFLIFGALAFLAPYLTLYYEEIGMNGQQIGILAAIPSLITFISAPFIGALADITRKHKRILGTSILFVIIGIFLMTFGNNFWGLVPGVFLYAFFFAPALPLIDRSVLEILGPDRDQYGKQRLWGAVGWGALAPIAGIVVDSWNLKWAFYGSAVLFLGLLVISQRAPIQAISLNVRFWRGVKQLLTNRQVLIFFAVILIGGMGLAMIHHYLFVYLSHLGASSIVMGTALSIATFSELLIMYFSDKLLKSWKSRGLILFGLFMIFVRLMGYSLTEHPQVALAIQLLHGPTFGAVWMAGVAYVAEIAPMGLGNTAQGIFTGVVMGLGSAAGALLGGLLYQSVGFSQMFLFSGLGVLAAFFVFWLGSRKI
jgi:PPP family 3-phenylpropionic acid transporter